ncbi:MAG: hypothetical protein HYX26_08520 [Acidobacteriales bacterium]|nr:hypothetical protein [Terriglobales bacterium]
MRSLLRIVAICIVGVLGVWAAYQASAPPPVSLARYMPQGALLYLEAKDFAGLLHQWDRSREKKEWLASVDHDVFMRSRLLLKLQDMQDQFAQAAGLPPDMQLLEQLAGNQSALSLYDIGKLEFVYVSRIPMGSAMRSTLWQTRGQYQTRTVAGKNFFLRVDAESKRVAAFAVLDDWVVIGTREDLVAGAIALLSGEKQRTLEEESWYADAVASAKGPGELRMVLELRKITVDPRFRTLWLPQNITELHGYRCAIADLYREGATYREERVLLRTDSQTSDDEEAARAVASLVPYVPNDTGYFRVQARPDIAEMTAALLGKAFTRTQGSFAGHDLAPTVALTGGETGSASDLETRIDIPPSSQPAAADPALGLRTLLEGADVEAMLVAQSTHRQRDDVFTGFDTGIILASSKEWDPAVVRSALDAVLRPGISASGLGMGWRESDGIFSLDGLYPLAYTVRGKLLIVGSDAARVSALTKPEGSSAAPAEFFAGFRHAQERERFSQMMGLMDRPYHTGSKLSDREPEFFSDNIAGLSAVLRGVESQEITIRAQGDRELQTVTYRWVP